MDQPHARRSLRRGLTLGATAFLTTALTPLAASAQDATWNGGTVDFNTGANWVPAIVPTNRATFSASGLTTVVTSTNTTLNAIAFDASAQQYTLINTNTMTVNGIGSEGITNNSVELQTLENNNILIFNNNANVVGGIGGIALNNISIVPSIHTITFNGSSGIDSNVFLTSEGGSASGVGVSAPAAGNATVTFNGTSHADGASISATGGNGGGQGGVGTTGSAAGGVSFVAFTGDSHADNAFITNRGGDGVGFGGDGAGGTGAGVGGVATINFTGNSHADNAVIANFTGSATAIGGTDTASGLGIGGIAFISFGGAAHADGASILNYDQGGNAFGGIGGTGQPAGTGTAGGTGVSTGGFANLSFTGTSHADNANITNIGGGTFAVGGAGGTGDTGGGGVGGEAVGNGGTATLSFDGSSHANGATIINAANGTIAIGGDGGQGSAAAGGGAGGSALTQLGSATTGFLGSAQANGVTLLNSGAIAIANGGNGGNGGIDGGGGGGGSATATGATALLLFSDNVTLGAGTTITNQAGNASATGGNGGTGGTGTGAGGAGGGAQADGGDAQIIFAGNASAGSATIINTAGTASVLTGSGGDGDVGDGGDGGNAVARGGDATITFNGNATAGSATITNNAGATITATAGTVGTDGGGGGQGGGFGFGSVSAASAIITFNNNATGGSARITNNGGQVTFNNNSVFGTAAGAQIINQQLGTVDFNDTSSLGSGTVTNGGATSSATVFHDSATAGSGTITNLVFGTLGFVDSATAGSATIANGGTTNFFDNSTMGTAVLNNLAGAVSFSGASDGVAGTLVNSASSQVNVNVNGFRLGSLSGAGTVNIFSTALQVGYLDRNETFSGIIAGTGALVKRGTGTFTLTGTNIYSGGTTIEAGTLQIGNGGTTGSVTGNIDVSAGANVTFNRSDTVVYANVISGAGTVTMNGSGGLLFTGNNTYTGVTTVNSGILQIGNGGTTGTIAGDLVINTGALSGFNRSDTLVYAGLISGGGQFAKAGAGTLILTNNNTYTGGTNVLAGTLQIGNGGTTGSIVGNVNVQTAATLAFNRSNNLTFGGVVSGGGSLAKLGAGTLILTGTNTYTGGTTVTGGILQIGNGGTTGSIVGNILNNAQVNFNRSDTYTYAGNMSGAGGSLHQIGTGTLILTGASTHSGGTWADAGTIELNGSLTFGTIVGAAGRLTGTGTAANGIVISGVIQPGNAANPFGTLSSTVNQVIFNAGSFLVPTVNAAGQTSLLQANTLTINGGTVRPTVVSGGLFLMQTDYRIAGATTARNGTFAGLDATGVPTFLTASLNYVGNDVFLRLRRNATTFAQTTGLTPNQAAVGGALDAAVPNNPLVFTTYLSTYNALLPLSGAQLQGALNTLSGDALTAFPMVAQEHANRFADRLNAYTWSNSSNLWGMIAYGDQNADSDGNGPGFNANGVEFQLGFNTSLGHNTRLGLSAGMNNGDVTVDDRLTTGNVDTWSLGAQLRHDFGQVYVSGQFTYSWHSIDSSRPLLIAGTATADYDAQTWTAGGELGWVIRSGHLSIEPHLSVRHASTSTDAYSEAGPAGALNVAATDYNTTRFGLGIRLANREPTAPVRFYMLARYEHQSGDDTAALDNALIGLPTYRVVGTDLGSNILSGELGAEFRISNGLSLFMAGGGHTRSNETSLQGNAGLRVVF